jgi:hypothetical protein
VRHCKLFGPRLAIFCQRVHNGEKKVVGKTNGMAPAATQASFEDTKIETNYTRIPKAVLFGELISWDRFFSSFGFALVLFTRKNNN